MPTIPTSRPGFGSSRRTAPAKARRRLFLSIGLAVAALLIVVGGLTMRAALQVRAAVDVARTALHTHNLALLTPEVPRLAASLTLLRDVAAPAWVLAPVPGVGGRVRALELLLAASQHGAVALRDLWPAVRQLAPLAGLADASRHTSGAATLQRIAPALPLLQRELPAAAPQVAALARDWDQVAWNRLPAALVRLNPHRRRTAAAVNRAASLLGLMATLAPSLPALLGSPHPARYLLLYQNSGEIRATGGFLTAYGYVTFQRGVPGHMTAANIYTLDPEFHPDPATYQPPEPLMLRTYLPWPVWHLRDSNVSPDVPTFAHTFYRFYDSIPGTPRVNGLILIDTWLVDRLIGNVGGIALPASDGGVVLTEANANEEMEYLAEKSGLPQSTRKAFLALVMRSLWQKVLTARGPELRHILGTLAWALNDKFLVVYANNPVAERALTTAGWAGATDRRVVGDYLQLVDENLNGHKDNFAIHESLSTRLARVHHRWIETTTVHWTNPAVGNGWMYVAYRAWIRLYVPRGSRLLRLEGVHGLEFVSQNPSLDKTVFNAHILMGVRASLAAPPAQHTLVAVYELPAGLNPSRLVLQKQPGARALAVTVSVGRWSTHFLLTSNRTVTLPAAALP